MADDVTVLIVALMVLQLVTIVPLGIFLRLGGYPEGLWRIMRVRYFVFWIIDPDNTMMRNVKRFTAIKTHSPSFFDHDNKRFYIDKLNTMRSKGRPAWLYQADNAFPVPTLTSNRDILLDPEKINRAFRTEIVKQLYKIRQGENKGTGLGRIALFVLIIVLGIAFAYLARGLFLHG